MRNYSALSCCLFLTFLCFYSVAQTNKQDIRNNNLIPFSRNFLSVKHNLYSSDSLPKKLSPPLREFSILKIQPKRIVQSYFKEKLLPIDFGKPVVSFKNTVLTAQATNNSIEAEDQGQEYIRQANFSSSVSLLSIPVSFGYVSNDGWSNDIKALSYTTAKFDKEAYLKQVRDKIIKRINPEVAFQSLLAPLYQKRNEAINNIRTDLMGVITKKYPVKLSDIQGKINAENLNFLGVDQFLNKILNDIRGEIASKENLLNELSGKSTQIDPLLPA